MGSPPPPPASKREALLALLDRGLVMIHLDARREGVTVPDYLACEHHLRLNLSYRFGLADLTIDDFGVSATLSFRGSGFHCRIPWHSLFAVTQEQGERGWLWPQDLPQELLDAMTAEAAEPAPALRALPDEPETSADGEPPPEEAPREPPRPPYLRLVK